nr:hypothetical protein [Sulfurospirillum sp. 'SP']
MKTVLKIAVELKKIIQQGHFRADAKFMGGETYYKRDISLYTKTDKNADTSI